MLEEVGLEYKVTKINLFKNEQFRPKFRKISPFSKIPVIIDHDNKKEAIFESGAILIYLAEKTNKFYNKNERLKINQWLMIQMSIVGPFIGQHHQFHYYNRGKSKFGEERYFKIAKKIYADLDERLKKSEFLAGKNYSIADIATWPWIARFQIHKINIKNYSNVMNWYNKIAKRPAVIKGYNIGKENNEIPIP